MKKMLTRKETMKNLTVAQERIIDDLFFESPMTRTRAALWMERFFCLWFLIKFFPNLTGSLLLFTTLVAITFFFFFLSPKLSSTGLSGFDGFCLFLLDGLMFLSSLHETSLHWRLTIFNSIMNSLFSGDDLHVIRSEFLAKYDKLHHDKTPQSTEPRETDDDDASKEEDWCLVKNMQYSESGGDAIKKVEKTRRLLKEFREDGKKMDLEVEFMEYMIHSGLETHMKNLSEKLLELRKELRDDGKKMKTYKELVNSFGNDLGLNVDDSRMKVDEGSKASRGERKSVAEEVRETYLVIQETVKAAKTTAKRINLTYLAAQAVTKEINAGSLEGYPELREEVRRISLDFAARRMEAKAAADRAAKELSRATEDLVEAVGIRQCDEYKTD